jgi:hypothetical protein
MSRDINHSKQKFKPKNAKDPGHPNSLLRLATERQQSEMVYLLAPYADQTGLNESLVVATVARDLGCIRVLLVEKSGLRTGACSENRVGDPIS